MEAKIVERYVYRSLHELLARHLLRLTETVDPEHTACHQAYAIGHRSVAQLGPGAAPLCPIAAARHAIILLWWQKIAASRLVRKYRAFLPYDLGSTTHDPFANHANLMAATVDHLEGAVVTRRARLEFAKWLMESVFKELMTRLYHAVMAFYVEGRSNELDYRAPEHSLQVQSPVWFLSNSPSGIRLNFIGTRVEMGELRDYSRATASHARYVSHFYNESAALKEAAERTRLRRARTWAAAHPPPAPVKLNGGLRLAEKEHRRILKTGHRR
jgi:hypothetical protein